MPSWPVRGQRAPASVSLLPALPFPHGLGKYGESSPLSSFSSDLCHCGRIFFCHIGRLRRNTHHGRWRRRRMHSERQFQLTRFLPHKNSSLGRRDDRQGIRRCESGTRLFRPALCTRQLRQRLSAHTALDPGANHRCRRQFRNSRRLRVSFRANSCLSAVKRRSAGFRNLAKLISLADGSTRSLRQHQLRQLVRHQ